MKNFIIGFLIGIVFGGAGGYAILKSVVQKVATKENIEKVVDVSKDIVDTTKDALK